MRFTLIILVPFVEIDKLFQLFIQLFPFFMFELVYFLCVLLFIGPSLSCRVLYLDCFDNCSLKSQYGACIGELGLNFTKAYLLLIRLEEQLIIVDGLFDVFLTDLLVIVTLPNTNSASAPLHTPARFWINTELVKHFLRHRDAVR